MSIRDHKTDALRYLFNSLEDLRITAHLYRLSTRGQHSMNPARIRALRQGYISRMTDEGYRLLDATQQAAERFPYTTTPGALREVTYKIKKAQYVGGPGQMFMVLSETGQTLGTHHRIVEVLAQMRVEDADVAMMSTKLHDLRLAPRHPDTVDDGEGTPLSEQELIETLREGYVSRCLMSSWDVDKSASDAAKRRYPDPVRSIVVHGYAVALTTYKGDPAFKVGTEVRRSVEAILELVNVGKGSPIRAMSIAALNQLSGGTVREHKDVRVRDLRIRANKSGYNGEWIFDVRRTTETRAFGFYRNIRSLLDGLDVTDANCADISAELEALKHPLT